MDVVQVFAQELGPRGIRVNCLCPGVIKTKFSEMVEELCALSTVMTQLQLWATPAGEEHFLKSIPLVIIIPSHPIPSHPIPFHQGRFGDADDCGGIVSFLASDDASYITGLPRIAIHSAMFNNRSKHRTGESFVVAGGMQSRL